jgi:hypothetical protein
MFQSFEDNAQQRVSAFSQQFTLREGIEREGVLIYRHRGVGPAYKVSAVQRARWTEAFSDKIYRSYRRIMLDTVLMFVSMIVSIRLFGHGHLPLEFGIGVGHLLLLAVFETYKEREAWNAPLDDLKGQPAFILGGGHDEVIRWYDRVDGLAGQTTPKLLLGMVAGAFALMMGLSPNARANFAVDGVHPWITGALYIAIGASVLIAGSIILIRRWTRR